MPLIGRGCFSMRSSCRRLSSRAPSPEFPGPGGSGLARDVVALGEGGSAEPDRLAFTALFGEKDEQHHQARAGEALDVAFSPEPVGHEEVELPLCFVGVPGGFRPVVGVTRWLVRVAGLVLLVQRDQVGLPGLGSDGDEVVGSQGLHRGSDAAGAFGGRVREAEQSGPRPGGFVGVVWGLRTAPDEREKKFERDRPAAAADVDVRHRRRQVDEALRDRDPHSAGLADAAVVLVSQADREEA